jgi:hypothetical protein
VTLSGRARRHDTHNSRHDARTTYERRGGRG